MIQWARQNYIHVLVSVGLLALGTFAGFRVGYILAECEVKDEAIRHGCGQYDYVNETTMKWRWTK